MKNNQAKDLQVQNFTNFEALHSSLKEVRNKFPQETAQFKTKTGWVERCEFWRPLLWFLVNSHKTKVLLTK